MSTAVRGPEEHRRVEHRLWTSVGLSPSEGTLDNASGCTVRIQEFGHGPPVVFVHGGSSSGANGQH